MGVSPLFAGALGAGGMVNWITVADEDRPIFDEWYDFEHLPERVSTPGFLRARRFIASEGHRPGHHDFLTLYETVDVDVLASSEYLRRLDAPTELTQRVVVLFREFRRAACTLTVARGVGSTGRVLAAEIEADSAAGLRDPIDRLLSRMIESHALHAGSLWEPDRAVSDAKATTAEGRSSRQQRTGEASLLLLEPPVGAEASALLTEMDDSLDGRLGTSGREYTCLFELRAHPDPTTAR